MNETQFNEYIKNAINAHNEVLELRNQLEAAIKKESILWRNYMLEGDNIAIPSERMFIKDATALYEVEFDIDDYDKPTIRRVDWHTTFMEMQ